MMEQVRRLVLQPLQDAASSLPLPWRVAVTLGPGLLLAFLFGPALLGLLLRWLARLLEGLALAYAWVEYQPLRLLRRSGWQPWALVATLDGGVEAVVVQGRKYADAIARGRPLRRAVRLATLALLAVPLLCWYAAPKAGPGSQLQARLQQGVTWTASFDRWVRTGGWPQASRVTAAKRPAHPKPSKARPGAKAKPKGQPSR